MALNAKKTNNSNRVVQPNLEPGVYPARLVQLIDLGLQAQRAWQGKEKPPAQEIMLTYELLDEFMVDEDGNELEDKPRWISETLPFFGLHADKAKSTQRYLTFDPNDNYDGDFSKAVGEACNVTVVNNAVKDKVYDNVASISAMRARDAANAPELKNPTKIFDLDNPDMEVFNSLPEWIQDKIKSNLNFAGSPLEKALGKAPAQKKEEAPKKAAKPAPKVEEGGNDEDNPY